MKTTALVCAVVSLFVLVALTANVLLILFAAVLFALVLHTLASGVARLLKVPLAVALGLIVFLIFGTIALTVTLAGPVLFEHVHEIAADLPRLVGIIRGRLHLEPAGSDVVAAGKELAQMGLGVFSASIVILMVGIFGAAQPSIYRRALLELVPKNRERAANKVIDLVVHELTRWILGRIVAMVFMGVTAWIAFVVLKLPMAGLLGLIAGLLAFVEYLGAFVSAVPPALLALSQGPGHVMSVLVVFTFLHVIEGYVLTPLLARKTVHIPPAAVLTGQLISGALLGPIALTFSTPLMVVGMATVVALRKVRDEDSLIGKSLRG